MADTVFQPITVDTDMAVEARDIVRGKAPEEIPGVTVQTQQHGGVSITIVNIEEESAQRLMGKPRGRYVTLDVPTFKDREADLRTSLIEALADSLGPLLPKALAEPILVVGLGNRQATPDALGPRVVDRLLVTRHLGEVLPDAVRQRMRPVAAIAPGVLGTTGMETMDILRGIVREVRPSTVVAVDALAARNLDRLLGSVQIADSGIRPGSGVGNRRSGLSEESIGVPVVAVGVCTVVPSLSIAQDALAQVARQLAGQAQFFEILGEMEDAEQRGLVQEVLGERLGDLMVTPKEIDLLIDDMADVVGEALNRALQPRLDRSEWL